MAKQKTKKLKPLLLATILLATVAVITIVLSNGNFFNTASISTSVLSPIISASITPSISPSLVATPSAIATPIPTPVVDNIQVMVDSMTIDEKIGQLVMGGYNDIDEILPIIKKYKLGGVILFQKNILSATQATKDISSLKASNTKNKIPLFVSVDQEGGRINRLPSSMGTFLSAKAIGDKNDSTYAFNAGVKIAIALKQLGFNLDFAPVLDIYSNPKNTVIGDRAFGTTADKVSKFGIQVMKGLNSKNIIPTAKHFPGHGDTEVDSHIGLPVVTKTVAELTSFEFKPFISAIENNVPMIMVAHILLSKVDTLPSSLSYKVVTNILRKQLGYNGVVITDDITMGAITENYTLADAAVKAINAGCDIVLVAQDSQNSIVVVNALKSAYQNGQITEKRIDESVYRILKLKYQYNLKDK